MQRQLDEIDLSSDINILLKIIKRTLTMFQILLMQETEYQKIVKLINKSSEEIKYLIDIAKRYKNKVIPPFNALQKMKIRLKDLISALRSKFNNGNTLREIKGFLQQIQIGMCIYQKNQDFAQIVNKIYNTISDQLRIFKIRYDLFHNKDNSDIPLVKVRKVQSLALDLTFSPVQHQTVSLASLYGIQMDYSFFKASIAQCKKNQLQFLQGQLQRNKIASKEIQSFMKDYHLHTNKYTNKRKHFSQLYTKNTNVNINSSYKNLRVKTTLNDKLHHNFDQKSFKKTTCKQNKEQISSYKLVYKINSVYVSGSQFNKYSDNSAKFNKIHQSNKKGSIFLTRGIRDPLVSKLNNSNTDQILAL